MEITRHSGYVEIMAGIVPDGKTEEEAL